MEPPRPHLPKPSLSQSVDPDSADKSARGGPEERDRPPLVLAFELGGLLNELDWHLHQAWIAGRKVDLALATQVLERIEICLVALFPESRGGQLRRTVGKMHEDWDDDMRTESLADYWIGCHEEANIHQDEPGCKQELLRKLLILVPTCRGDLDEPIRKELNRSPKMELAFRLGECIDEWLRTRDIDEHLIELQTSREWLEWEQLQQQRKERTPPPQGWWRLPEPKRHEWKGVSREPGDIPPARNWYAEVEVLWERLGIATALPGPLSPTSDKPDERRLHHKKVVKAAQDGLSHLTCDDWETGPTDQIWPPKHGWHFRKGEFAFAGKRYTLTGKQLILLNVLVKAQSPRTQDELIRMVWGKDVKVDVDLRNNIREIMTQLRRFLRQRFRLPKESDPIPRKRDDTGAWTWCLDKALIDAYVVK
jgi:hypothetical protein